MSEYYLHNHYKPNVLRFFGVLSLVFALVLIYYFMKYERSYPEYGELIYSEGNITLETPPNKRSPGVYFSLSNSDPKFVYTSKSGAIKKVRKSTKSGLVAKVGYYENGKVRSHQSTSGFKFVFDLELEGKKFRSYEEIRAATNFDNKFLLILVPWFIFSFMGLFWMANFHKKKIDQENFK